MFCITDEKLYQSFTNSDMISVKFGKTFFRQCKCLSQRFSLIFAPIVLPHFCMESFMSRINMPTTVLESFEFRALLCKSY